MRISYKPQGICARQIDIEVEDGKVVSANIIGGCDGNHKGISSLVAGMDIKDVIKRLRGIKCGFKDTSCPDQLAVALESYLAK